METLTMQEAAARLGISRRTLFYWCKKSAIECKDGISTVQLHSLAQAHGRALAPGAVQQVQRTKQEPPRIPSRQSPYQHLAARLLALEDAFAITDSAYSEAIASLQQQITTLKHALQRAGLEISRPELPVVRQQAGKEAPGTAEAPPMR
jgi:hypothetical protein